MQVRTTSRKLPGAGDVEEAAPVEEEVLEDVVEDELRRQGHRRKNKMRPGHDVAFRICAIQEPKEKAANPARKKDIGIKPRLVH